MFYLIGAGVLIYIYSDQIKDYAVRFACRHLVKPKSNMNRMIDIGAIELDDF